MQASAAESAHSLFETGSLNDIKTSKKIPVGQTD